MFVSSQLSHLLQHSQFLQGKVMLELAIEYFGFMKIDLDVKWIIDKYCIVLFVVYLEESISQNCIGLFHIVEGCFELSLS